MPPPLDDAGEAETQPADSPTDPTSASTGAPHRGIAPHTREPVDAPTRSGDPEPRDAATNDAVTTQEDAAERARREISVLQRYLTHDDGTSSPQERHASVMAWNALYARLTPRIAAVFRRYVRQSDSDAAEDFAQDVWYRVQRNLSALDSPEKLDKWVIGIAHNEARRAYGAQKRFKLRNARVLMDGLGWSQTNDPPDDVLLAIINGELRRRAFAKLTPQHAELARRKLDTDQSDHEIAAALGYSVATVAVIWHRIRARWRDEFKRDAGRSTRLPIERPPTYDPGAG